jgi:hypothetical protein
MSGGERGDILRRREEEGMRILLPSRVAHMARAELIDQLLRVVSLRGIGRLDTPAVHWIRPLWPPDAPCREIPDTLPGRVRFELAHGCRVHHGMLYPFSPEIQRAVLDTALRDTRVLELQVFTPESGWFYLVVIITDPE